jgi:hypothetical protein
MMSSLPLVRGRTSPWQELRIARTAVGLASLATGLVVLASFVGRQGGGATTLYYEWGLDDPTTETGGERERVRNVIDYDDKPNGRFSKNFADSRFPLKDDLTWLGDKQHLRLDSQYVDWDADARQEWLGYPGRSIKEQNSELAGDPGAVPEGYSAAWMSDSIANQRMFRERYGGRPEYPHEPRWNEVNRVMQERADGDGSVRESGLNSRANIEGTDWERYPYRRGDNQIPGLSYSKAEPMPPALQAKVAQDSAEARLQEERVEPREEDDQRYSYFWPVENMMGYPSDTLDARRTFEYDQSTGGEDYDGFWGGKDAISKDMEAREQYFKRPDGESRESQIYWDSDGEQPEGADEQAQFDAFWREGEGARLTADLGGVASGDMDGDGGFVHAYRARYNDDQAWDSPAWQERSELPSIFGGPEQGESAVAYPWALYHYAVDGTGHDLSRLGGVSAEEVEEGFADPFQGTSGDLY